MLNWPLPVEEAISYATLKLGQEKELCFNEERGLGYGYLAKEQLRWNLDGLRDSNHDVSSVHPEYVINEHSD
jgi:hypothetical protein